MYMPARPATAMTITIAWKPRVTTSRVTTSATATAPAATTGASDDLRTRMMFFSFRPGTGRCHDSVADPDLRRTRLIPQTPALDSVRINCGPAFILAAPGPAPAGSRVTD